jgi:hypothetical protein
VSGAFTPSAGGPGAINVYLMHEAGTTWYTGETGKGFYVWGAQVSFGELVPYSKTTTASVGRNLLTAAESSFEGPTTGGWSGPGLATVATPWTGSHALSFYVDAEWDGVETLRYLPVVAGRTYTFSAYVRWLVANVNTFAVRMLWADAARQTLSYSDWGLYGGNETYQRMVSTGVAPAGAAFCRLQIYVPPTVTGTATAYVDGVQLEEGGLTPWMVGVDAPAIHNPGNVDAFPDLLVTFNGTSAGGFDLTIGGRRIDYDATCSSGDVVRIDCLNGRVYHNDVPLPSALNLANTSTEFPVLAPGDNPVTLTAGTNLQVSAVFRGAYE